MGDDEEACAECGEYFPPEDLTLGICEDCHDGHEEELQVSAFAEAEADRRYYQFITR